jgi:hypothetical protein
MGIQAMKWHFLIVLVLIATVLWGCAQPSLSPTPTTTPQPETTSPAITSPPPEPTPPSETTPPETTPLPAITGLAAGVTDNGRVVLNWDQSTAAGFDHYNVYLSKTEITSVTGITPAQQITDITTNTCQITGLEDGTKYYFAVTAADKSGHESPIVTTTVTTLVAGEPPPPSDTTPPETMIVSGPSGSTGYTEVTFQWTGSDETTPTAGLSYSYQLEGYDAEFSPFTPDTSKTYTNLPGGSYIFYVKARDEAGNIDPTPATSRFAIATATPAGLLILSKSEVNRIAVGSNGQTIYALDAVNAKLYKSSHGGYGWVDISAGLTAPPTWDELAVAPDAPEIVAVVTNSRTDVYLSINGGDVFAATGLAGKLAGGEFVQCVAISPSYDGSARELAVGTSTGHGGGRVWVFSIPFSASGWTDVSRGAAGWLPGVPPIAGTDVFAIQYSPAFPADKMMLAIISSGPAPDTDDTYLYIGKRVDPRTMVWNSRVLPGYPVEISQPGEDSPGSPLTYASLTLPSDYFALDPSSRRVYASWSDNPRGTAIAGNPNDDVYRLDDISDGSLLVTRLYAGGGREAIISSLAYYGTSDEGKLLAGAMMGTPGRSGIPVYFTDNPQSNLPTWRTSDSLKSPTGRHEAQVAWSPDGSAAYCGTSTIGGASHDQSAFSRSTNDGLSWNQTGLIDT